MTRSMTCFCTAAMTSPDLETLVPLVLDHFDVKHPELGLNERKVRNYLESEARSTGPVQRLENIGEIEIRPITTDSTDDVARFFDTDAFPDNAAWGSCYCMYYFRGGKDNTDWGNEPWQKVRRDQLTRIASGQTTGTLAYIDGKMVGWCNATARSEFPGLTDGQDQGVVSIVCFAIAPPYRRHGVATRLLEGVVNHSKQNGAIRLEAYPVRDPDDEQAAYHGSLDLYEKVGFQVRSDEPLTVGLDL